MRRIIAAVTAAAAALTLTGCAGEGAAIDGLRERLISARAVTMDVEITSTIGGRLAEYGLSLERTTEGDTLTVLAPEEIAGAVLSGPGGGGFEYAGLVLDMPSEGLNAAAAPGLLLDAIESGAETLSWREGEDTLVSLALTDEISVTLTLRGGEPAYAEFTASGESALTAEISKFELGG